MLSSFRRCKHFMASMDNPNKWRRVDYSLEALAKQFDDGNIQVGNCLCTQKRGLPNFLYF